MTDGYPITRAALADAIVELMEGVNSCPVNDILVAAIERQARAIDPESEAYSMIRKAHSALLTSVLKGFPQFYRVWHHHNGVRTLMLIRRAPRRPRKPR